MRSIVLSVLLSFGFAGLASGCSTESEPDPPEEPSAMLTRSSLGDEDEMLAIVGGKLQLDADGCILLSGSPVVWPAQTTLSADRTELQLPGGLVARSSDVVTGGGGEVPVARIRDTGLRIDGDLTKALSCAAPESKIVVFATQGESLEVSPAD